MTDDLKRLSNSAGKGFKVVQFLSRFNTFFHLFRTLTVVLILSAKVKVSVETESSNSGSKQK